MENHIEIKNKKAFFEFTILDKFIAGMVLKGTEIKSIRQGKASIAEAYCVEHKGEIWIRNMEVQPWEKASFYNHEPKADRKLLLQASEIKKIIQALKDTGMTLIPLRLFISEKGYAKAEIGLAKGKKLHDKRESIRERETQREIMRKVRKG